MTGFSRITHATLCGLVLAGLTLSGRAAAPAPSFQEIFDLLKVHMVDADASGLEKMAVEGLVRALYPRVTWITNGPPPSGAAEGPSVSKTTLHDRAFGYVRVRRVDDRLPDEIQAAMNNLGRTNRILGWVLDLRFAEGQDYRAAAAVADRFTASERPLLSWGDEAVRSRAKDDAVNVPITVLVNRQTQGAAEALAAVLRQTEVALLLGTNTAGRAFVTRDFQLKSGQRLRIATARVEVGGQEPIPLTGVKPDIVVPVSPADEQAYYEDAFKVLVKSGPGASGAETNLLAAGTNRPRHRINEAELVRLFRDGEEAETPARTGARSGEPGRPIVRDPVLARALDLLKGLAVVKRGR